MLNLYLISQKLQNKKFGGFYEAILVAAYNQQEAIHINPDNEQFDFESCYDCAVKKWNKNSDSWVEYKNIDQLDIKWIGVAVADTKTGVIHKSFVDYS